MRVLRRSLYQLGLLAAVSFLVHPASKMGVVCTDFFCRFWGASFQISFLSRCCGVRILGPWACVPTTPDRQTHEYG